MPRPLCLYPPSGLPARVTACAAADWPSHSHFQDPKAELPEFITRTTPCKPPAQLASGRKPAPGHGYSVTVPIPFVQGQQQQQQQPDEVSVDTESLPDAMLAMAVLLQNVPGLRCNQVQLQLLFTARSVALLLLGDWVLLCRRTWIFLIGTQAAKWLRTASRSCRR
jgi:hypothetical protein